MNLILGSGITGLLARKILGDQWTIIPYKRSRYYQFEIPWADNYIKFDENVDDFMRPILPGNAVKVFYRSPFSYAGQLMYQSIDLTQKPYLEKVYGDRVPSIANRLLSTSFMVYPVTVQALYKALQDKYINEIRNNITKYGEVSVIDVGSHEVRFKGRDNVVVYDNIISTIPLDILCGLLMLQMDLEAKPVIYYHISTTDVDLEGAQQSYVCDREIDFFKVQMLNKTNYLFWCREALSDAYKYFGLILGYKFNIMEVRRIDDVIPIGDPPDLSVLTDRNIFCVGSNAQWDDFMDTSSCIKRLINLSPRLS